MWAISASALECAHAERRDGGKRSRSGVRDEVLACWLLASPLFAFLGGRIDLFLGLLFGFVSDGFGLDPFVVARGVILFLGRFRGTLVQLGSGYDGRLRVRLGRRDNRSERRWRELDQVDPDVPPGATVDGRRRLPGRYALLDLVPELIELSLARPTMSDRIGVSIALVRRCGRSEIRRTE